MDLAGMACKYHARNLLPRPDEPKTDQPLYVVVVKTSIKSSIPGHISQYCKLYLNVINLSIGL